MSGVPKPQSAARPFSVRTPAAPPVYRPQPVPVVLQRKQPVTQPTEPSRLKPKPVAPPVYRPQPKQPAQMKVFNAPQNGRPINQTKPPAPTPAPSKRSFNASTNNGAPVHRNAPKPGLPRVPNLTAKNHKLFPSANLRPSAPKTIQRRRTSANNSDVVQRNLFNRLVGAVVGGATGAYAGFTTGAAIGASIGSTAGAVAGSAVPVAGTAAGGVAGGMTGGTVGGMVGGLVGMVGGVYAGLWATTPSTPPNSGSSTVTSSLATTGATLASDDVQVTRSVTPVSSGDDAIAREEVTVHGVAGAASKKKKKKKKTGAGAGAATVVRPTYKASKAKFDEIKKYHDKLGRLNDWRFAPNSDLSGTVSLSATRIPNAGSGRRFRGGGNCIYENREGYLPAGTYNEFWVTGGTPGSQRLIVADGDSEAQKGTEKWFTSGGTHGGVQYWRKWTGAVWKNWDTVNRTASDFVIAAPTLLTQVEADVLTRRGVLVPRAYIV